MFCLFVEQLLPVPAGKYDASESDVAATEDKRFIECLRMKQKRFNKMQNGSRWC